jgi:nicotinamidase-related amidase
MEAGMTDFKFDPRRTALLNIDMQNCFVENSPVAAPRGREIVPRINKLAEVCRKRGALVIHTLHLVRPDGSNTGVMGVIIPAIAAGLINKGNKQAELHPDIVVGRNDIILEKPRYGAFHGTDLDLILRNRGIDTVIVTGICTNVCCETTAREANMRDYKVFFISDATATFNTPEVSADPDSTGRAGNTEGGLCADRKHRQHDPQAGRAPERIRGVRSGEHDLFGKPVPTFPDHALRRREVRENLEFQAVGLGEIDVGQ